MLKDKVEVKKLMKCNSCGKEFLVDPYLNRCPKCGTSGNLAWVDDNIHEVEDNEVCFIEIRRPLYGTYVMITYEYDKEFHVMCNEKTIAVFDTYTEARAWAEENIIKGYEYPKRGKE